jgi:NADH:ubiquinone oxidoreductase subunit E
MSATPTAIGSGPAWLRRVLGEAHDQMRVARGLAVAAMVVVFVATSVLIATHIAYVWNAGADEARIVELEGRTKGDPEVAARLHEERKRQTDASVARETRGRVLAWVLLAASGVFVAAERWWESLRPDRVPSLEELVAARFGDVAGEMNRPGRHLGRDKARRGAEKDAPGNGREEGAGAEGVAAAEARSEGEGHVAPESVDLTIVDALIDQFGRDKESAIPILQAIQAHFRYLPDEALKHVCEKTEITPAQIAGTSSFYSQFRRSPVGRHVVRVCHGTACHVAGAEQITEELRRHLEIPPDEDTDAQRRFTLDKVACLGCCSLAPVMMIEEDTAGRLTPATARQALDAVAKDS